MNANMLKLVVVFFTLAWLIMSAGTITGLTKLPVGLKLQRAEPAIALQSDPIVVTPRLSRPIHAER